MGVPVGRSKADEETGPFGEDYLRKNSVQYVLVLLVRAIPAGQSSVLLLSFTGGCPVQRDHNNYDKMNYGVAKKDLSVCNPVPDPLNSRLPVT